MINRQEEERKLSQIFGIKNFYDHQWKTIVKILNGDRVFLIEKTGFGKSLCYQYTATQFDGTTIIFCPLISLMRDQVNYLKSINIPSECITYENGEGVNDKIMSEALNGKLKILYISPERQENIEWLEIVKDINISMIVVDEAHCISMWGHTFRPSYRRIVNLVNQLPKNFPVLATTATATKRTTEDAMEQIGRDIQLIRGDLLRKNFYLNTLKVKNEEEKMGWLIDFLSKQDGTGIIYTGTRVKTEWFSAWLEFNGISSINYHAGLDADARKEIEKGLMENRWKVVVSTNALGMGIDKPDIRFVIHTQVPQSPVHYYQEIGRGGRDGLPTKLFLLYNEDEDMDLPKSFIRNNRPSVEKYYRVIDVLKKEALGLHNILKATNLKQTSLRVILSDLIDQGIANQALYGRLKRYEIKFDAKELDTEGFEELRYFEEQELKAIIGYINSSLCKMNYLCQYLGDNQSICGKCDVCRENINSYQIPNHLINKIEEFKNTYFPDLKVESKKSNIVNGVASSYYGISNVGKTLNKCKYKDGGDFPSHLLKRTLRAFRHKFKNQNFDLILYVPPTKSGDLVKNFSEKVSKVLDIPISHKLSKTRESKEQKALENYPLKRENVKGIFYYPNPEEIKGKSILLIDDIFDSGQTVKEIGLYLTGIGANIIAPVVIAKCIAGDI